MGEQSQEPQRIRSGPPARLWALTGADNVDHGHLRDKAPSLAFYLTCENVFCRLSLFRISPNENNNNKVLQSWEGCTMSIFRPRRYNETENDLKV